MNFTSLALSLRPSMIYKGQHEARKRKKYETRALNARNKNISSSKEQ
jgi:hypothetical protein